MQNPEDKLINNPVNLTPDAYNEPETPNNTVVLDNSSVDLQAPLNVAPRVTPEEQFTGVTDTQQTLVDMGVYRGLPSTTPTPEAGRFPGVYQITNQYNQAQSPLTSFAFSQTASIAAAASANASQQQVQLNSMVSQALRKREAEQQNVLERLALGTRSSLYEKPQDRPFNPFALEFGERGGGLLGALGYALGTLGGIPKVVGAKLFQTIDPKDPGGAFELFKGLNYSESRIPSERALYNNAITQIGNRKYNPFLSVLAMLAASPTPIVGMLNPFQDNSLNSKVANRGFKRNFGDLLTGRQFDDTDNRYTEDGLFYDRTIRWVPQGQKGWDARDVSRIIAGKVWDNFTNPGEMLTDALLVDKVIKPIVGKAFKGVVSTSRKLRGTGKLAEATQESLETAAKTFTEVEPYGINSIDPSTGKPWQQNLSLPQLPDGSNVASRQATIEAQVKARRLAVERATKEANRALDIDAKKRATMAANQAARVSAKQQQIASEAVEATPLNLPNKVKRQINFQAIPVEDADKLAKSFNNNFARNQMRRTASERTIDSATKAGNDAAKRVGELIEVDFQTSRLAISSVDLNHTKPFWEYFTETDQVAKLVDADGNVVPIINQATKKAPEAVVDATFEPLEATIEIKQPVMRRGKPTKRLKVTARLTETEYTRWVENSLGGDAWKTLSLPNPKPLTINLQPKLKGAVDVAVTRLPSQEAAELTQDLWRKTVEQIPVVTKSAINETTATIEPQKLLAGVPDVEPLKQLPPAAQVKFANEATRLGFTPEILASLSPAQRQLMPRFVEEAGQLVAIKKQAIETPIELLASSKQATGVAEALGQPNIIEPQKLLNSTGELVVRQDGSVAIELADDAGALVLSPDGALQKVAATNSELAAPRLNMEATLEPDDFSSLLSGDPTSEVLNLKQQLDLAAAPDQKLLTGVVNDDVLTASTAKFNETITRIIVNDEVSYAMFDNGAPKLLAPARSTGNIDGVQNSYRLFESNLRKNFYYLANKPELVNNAKAVMLSNLTGEVIDAQVVAKGIQEALDDSLSRNLWDDIAEEYMSYSASTSNRYYRNIIDDNFGGIREEPFKLLGTAEETKRLALPASTLSDLERQLEALSRDLQLPIDYYLVPNKQAVEIMNDAGEVVGRVIDGKLIPTTVTDVTGSLNLSSLKQLPPATEVNVAGLLKQANDLNPELAAKPVKLNTTAKLGDNFKMDIMVPEVEKLVPAKRLDNGTAKIPGDRLKRSLQTDIPSVAIRSDGSLVVSANSLTEDVLDALPFNTGTQIGVPTKLGLLTLDELNAIPHRLLATIVDDVTEVKNQVLLAIGNLGDKELFDALPFKSSVDYNDVDKMLDIDSQLLPEVISNLSPKQIKAGTTLGMHGTSVEDWIPIRNPYSESLGDLGFGTYVTDSVDEARVYAAKVADETLSSDVIPGRFNNIHKLTVREPLNVVDASKTIGSSGIVKWFNDLGLDASSLPRKFTTGKAHSIQQWYKELYSMTVSESDLRLFVNALDEYLLRNGVDAVRSKALGFTKIMNTDKVTAGLVESTMDAIDDSSSFFNNLVNSYSLSVKTAYQNPVAFSRAVNNKLDVLRGIYNRLEETTKGGFEYLYSKVTATSDDVAAVSIKADIDDVAKYTDEVADELDELGATRGLRNPCDF